MSRVRQSTVWTSCSPPAKIPRYARLPARVPAQKLMDLRMQARSLGDRTTIFQKTASTYQLKMKTSRSTYGEIVKKSGSFPFTLRTLEDEQKARMGVKECVQHGLLKEFDVT